MTKTSGTSTIVLAVVLLVIGACGNGDSSGGGSTADTAPDAAGDVPSSTDASRADAPTANDAVVVEETTGATDGGTGQQPDITYVTGAVPEANPPNYTFTNATPSTPELQTFVISNNADTGVTPFHIFAIEFEQPTDVFGFEELPSLPASVKDNQSCSSATQAGCSVSFMVSYHPASDSQPDESNTVLVTTDASPDPLQVPLQAELLLSGYELSYSDEEKFDFSNVSETQTRSLLLIATGSMPMKVKEPSIDPVDVGEVFTWQAFKPATAAGEQDELIDSWPRLLMEGKSIRFEVTFQPPGSSNGQLLIPVEAPDEELIAVDLLASTPEP